MLGYLLEIMSTTPGEAMQALRIENMGIPLVAPFFFLTAIGFFMQKLLKPWMVIISIIYGLAMFIVVFTNDSHMLYYSSIELAFNGSFFYPILERGPIYIVQQIVSIACMLSVYVLLAATFIRGSKKLRRQMDLFIIGSLFGFFANIANITGIVPYGIDPTPIGLSLGLIFFAFSLYHHKHMDIVPRAFDMAVEKMNDAMIIVDSEWSFIFCNQSAKDIFPELENYSGAEDVRCITAWPQELNFGEKSDTKFSIKNHATDELALKSATVDDIYDMHDKKIGVSIVIKDITETTNMVKKLEELAIKDPLTGLYNRRHFTSYFNNQISLSKRYDFSVGLILFDLDYFKSINDNYGHVAGDYVLSKTASAISKKLRAHEMLARYGGEEFIILSTEKEAEGLKLFAERLRKTIESEIFDYEGHTIRVTASFGCAIVRKEQIFEEAVEIVDKALYEAKDSGRNMVIVRSTSE